MYKILTGRNRQEQESFKRFRSYYLFESNYCNPAQGHEKRVNGACGNLVKAARLLGAAEALRQSARNPVEGTEMQFYTGIISQARLGLDEQSFTTAWVDGYTMTWEQAVAYALEEQP